MREVFKCCESHDASILVEDCDGEQRGFDEFEHLGVGVDAVVHVVLANLNQVNNLIAVVRVRPSEHDALEVEIAFLLLIHFHISFHLFLC